MKWMKPKYMLMYAKDVKIPPQLDNSNNTEMKAFRTKLGFIWFLICNRAPREAIQADRFRFITIEGK